MKVFLYNEMLKPIVEWMHTHLECTYPVLKKHGTVLAIMKFCLQLDSYWHKKAPFNKAKPVQDSNVLGWWWHFLNDSEADVLVVCHSKSLSLVID